LCSFTASAPGGQSIKFPNCGNAPVGSNFWQIYKTMKSNTKKVMPILFVTLLCVSSNLYWFFHRSNDSKFYIQLNILTAFTIMVAVLLPAIKQQLKK
jgi:hypothetical protein